MCVDLRAPVFGSTYNDADVIQSLLGNQPLPWELDSGLFDMIPNKDARNLIRNLLRYDSPPPHDHAPQTCHSAGESRRRDPAVRWDIEDALKCPFFGGLPSMPQRQASHHRNPSYSNPAFPRTTVNPAAPQRPSAEPGSAALASPEKRMSQTAAPSTPQQRREAPVEQPSPALPLVAVAAEEVCSPTLPLLPLETLEWVSRP